MPIMFCHHCSGALALIRRDLWKLHRVESADAASSRVNCCVFVWKPSDTSTDARRLRFGISLFPFNLHRRRKKRDETFCVLIEGVVRGSYILITSFTARHQHRVRWNETLILLLLLVRLSSSPPPPHLPPKSLRLGNSLLTWSSIVRWTWIEFPGYWNANSDFPSRPAALVYVLVRLTGIPFYF